jgi:hypothetical protein
MGGELPDDAEAALDQLEETEGGDGLPVVPPTDERVDRTLEETSVGAEHAITTVPTSGRTLTVERLAECAVMAGCRPAYFPVLVAAFDGFDRMENLGAALATTSGFAAAAVVNGPIRDELGFNAGTGLFGPGYRANATVGRAINLTFMAVGGTRPGSGTMATHTHPGRYTYCFAENEDASAWDPLHVARGGLDADDSAVTTFCLQAPKLVSEGNDTEVADVLDALAEGVTGAQATGGPTGETVVVLSEDHAGRLGEARTRDDVAEYLVAHAERSNGSALFDSPDEVFIIAGGGIGNYSSAIPMWPRGTPPQTVAVDR